MAGKWGVLKDAMVRFVQPLEYQQKIDQMKEELGLREKKRGEIASILAVTRAQKEALEEQLKVLGYRFEACSQTLVDMLEADGESKFATEVGTFSIKDDPYSSVQDKHQFLKFIRESGQEDLMTVNYQTMSSLNKARLEAGEEPMPGTAIFMKSSISFRKTK